MSRRPVLRLWGWPVALALLTASGLLSALVADGLGDAWAWCALGLPVATMAWFGLPWRRTPNLPDTSHRDPR